MAPLLQNCRLHGSSDRGESCRGTNSNGGTCREIYWSRSAMTCFRTTTRQILPTVCIRYMEPGRPKTSSERPGRLCCAAGSLEQRNRGSVLSKNCAPNVTRLERYGARSPRWSTSKAFATRRSLGRLCSPNLLHTARSIRYQRPKHERRNRGGGVRVRRVVTISGVGRRRAATLAAASLPLRHRRQGRAR